MHLRTAQQQFSLSASTKDIRTILFPRLNIYSADALRDIMKNDSRFQANYHIERSAIVKNGISS